MHCVLRHLAVIALSVLGASLAGTAQGQVVILPNTTSPTGEGQAISINNAGQVAGQIVGATTPTNPNAPRSAAIWSNFSPIALPKPAGAPVGGQQSNIAFGINNTGFAVGMVAWPITGNEFASHAVRWNNAIATDLGVVPGSAVSHARAINAAGDIAGNGFGAAETAVRWTAAGTLKTLDRLPTHTDSIAWRINSAGRIAGQSGISDGGGSYYELRPVYWDGTTATELPTPIGFNHGLARGISDAGTIVGSSASFDDTDTLSYLDYRATRWDAGAPSLLPNLPGFSFGTAQSVNASGLVIGACYSDVNNAAFGFGGVPVLWSGDTVTDLSPLLAPSFPTGSTFSVSDINASGQIVGTAVTVDGQKAFVLTVPEPTSLGLLAIGGTLLVRRRKI